MRSPTTRSSSSQARFKATSCAAAIRLSDLDTSWRRFPTSPRAFHSAVSRVLVRYGHNIGRFTLSPSESSDPFAKLPLAYGRNLSHDDIASASDVDRHQLEDVSTALS